MREIGCHLPGMILLVSIHQLIFPFTLLQQALLKKDGKRQSLILNNGNTV